MNAPTERLRIIVDELGIEADDHVLEIGCGHGVAASYICEKLQTGQYTAIDRSPKMIEAARNRNKAYIHSGTAEFLVDSLETAELGNRRFDKILAIRVGLFKREPELAHRLAERWLKPGGKVFSYYDTPHE